MITPNLIEAADYIMAVDSAIHDGSPTKNKHAEAIYNHVVASVGIKYANEYALAVLVMICRGLGPFDCFTAGEKADVLNELSRLLSFYGEPFFRSIKNGSFQIPICVSRAFVQGCVYTEKFFGASQPTIKDFELLFCGRAPHPSIIPIIERFHKNNKTYEEE